MGSHRLAAALLTVTLTACTAPAARLNTESGAPEVQLAGYPKKVLMEKFVNYMLTRNAANGWTFKSSTDFDLVFEKRGGASVGEVLAYGSGYDRQPAARAKVTFVQDGRLVKIFGRAEMVTNPGSGSERIADVTNDRGQQLQGWLQDFVRNAANL